MTNNDVIRSFRFAMELDPQALAAFFAEGGEQVSLRRLASYLKADDEPGFEELPDATFACFLEGVVTAHRGRREASEPRAPVRITNNSILRALRIAYELRDSDIGALMSEAGIEVSKTELSALFRREDHRNYQPCGDQFLRTFLRGLGLWHRAGRPRSA